MKPSVGSNRIRTVGGLKKKRESGSRTKNSSESDTGMQSAELIRFKLVAPTDKDPTRRPDVVGLGQILSRIIIIITIYETRVLSNNPFQVNFLHIATGIRWKL